MPTWHHARLPPCRGPSSPALKSAAVLLAQGRAKLPGHGRDKLAGRRELAGHGRDKLVG